MHSNRDSALSKAHSTIAFEEQVWTALIHVFPWARNLPLDGFERYERSRALSEASPTLWMLPSQNSACLLRTRAEVAFTTSP